MKTRKDRIKAATEALAGNMKAVNDLVPKKRLSFKHTVGGELYYCQALDLVLTLKEFETFKAENHRIEIILVNRTVITKENAHEFIK